MREKKGSFFGSAAIIVALAVLAAAVAITVNYHETLKFNAFQSTLLQVDEVTPKIDGWFKIRFGAMDRDLAFLNSKANLTKIDVSEYFAQVLRRNGGDYIDIYVGWPDGSATFGGGWVPGADWDSRQLDWYQAAADNPGNVIVSAPFIDPATGKLCVRLSSTIATFNPDRGVFAAELPLDALTAYLNQANQIKDAHVFLVDGEGNVLLHPNPAYMPSPDGVFSSIRTIEGGRFVNYWETVIRDNNLSIVENKGADGSGVHFTASRLTSADWYLIAEITPSAGFAGATFLTMLAIQGLIVLAIIICLILLFLLVSKSAAGPPKELTDAAEKLSLGQVDAGIDPDKYSGETRYLAESLLYIASNAKALEKTIEAAAKGDYNVSAEPRSDEDKLIRAINLMLSNASGLISQIGAEASRLAGCASAASAGLDLMAGDSGKKTTLWEQISASTADMIQKAENCHEITGKAALLAGIILENAQNSGAQIREISALMADVSQSSQNIETSIGQIGDLATQTNLLALNAAMEAAMAGKYGQRFAELADNMRELAVKIAETAGQAKDLSAAATEKVAAAARKAEDILPPLEEIESGLKEQSGMIGEATDHASVILTNAKQMKGRAGEAAGTTGPNLEPVVAAVKDIDAIAHSITELTGGKSRKV